jgi:tetratricopeptide (TPR) repeat protein
VTASTPLTAPQGQARSPAAQEALAQAQQLWNAGSRSAAIDLLHEALILAERANLAGAPSGSSSVIASIARELARMELAEGRVSQVLVLLTRLEPLLSDVADIWAIRGNAAQRLGQHPESAAAYLMALKLRPNEPRWMLGAAVSLAAQGQTSAAAELAEKARDGGALSPEVASYLRQLGVPLRAH